jgi:prepilin-type N-terminal cleavage/methylation domain-containing protein
MMRPSTHPAPLGFTLIEMLIVISIITILGGLVLTAIGVASRTSKENATRAIIKQLEAALMRYESDFQDYPPSDGDSQGMKGSENLWKYLRTEKKEGPYITSKEIPICDSDHNGEMEIADGFKRTILYVHHRDYSNKPPNKRTYRLISSGADGKMDEGQRNSDDIVNWNKDKPE